MSSQSEWENSCRLCAEEKTEMLQIFGEEGIRRRIAQKLRVCLPILVYKTDPLPKQICQFCAARLDDAYEFREHCLSVYKTMHLKLLARKNFDSVKIFLDAMSNSPDPCQVQLCVIKQRAPPPLVPLPPASLPLSHLPILLETIKTPSLPNDNLDLLPELPCEVQIKEEPMDLLNKLNFDTEADENQSLTGGSDDQHDELNNYLEQNHEHENNSTGGESNNERKSILERALTGNLTIDDCKDLTPKIKLSSQWWCSPCNSYYKSKQSLIKHMQQCPRKYGCGKCSLVFKTVEELAKHEGKDHLKVSLDFDKNVKECHQCDREFVSWEMLRHHRLRDHLAGTIEIGTNTWCQLCNRFFPNLESYDSHNQLHEDENAGLPDTIGHKVDDDDAVQINEDGLEDAKREHIAENIKSLVCPTCGKVCSQQSALSNHMRAHEPKKHKCDICGRSFGLFIRLAAHKLTEHNQPPSVSPVMASVEQEEALNAQREAREARDAKLKNDLCRTYSDTIDNGDTTSDLQHPVKRAATLNTYTSKNVARCGICQQWFSDHTTMLAHLQTHSDNFVVKNFSCNKCKKSFKEKWQLQRHEISHKRTKNSTYECSVCHKSYPDKIQLDAHEKIHIVDRTYHCSKCNKIFFKELSLATHQCRKISLFNMKKRNSSIKSNHNKKDSHTLDDKKYKCPKCPSIFNTSQLRNLHIRIHVKTKLPQIEMNVVNENQSMPKLIPEAYSGDPISLLEPKVEISEEQNNVPIPLKRTLIRTAGGYRCGVCQSPFVLRELAVAHLRSAHPVMPYQCPYCKKRFTTQYTFTHHIKTNHPNESEK